MRTALDPIMFCEQIPQNFSDALNVQKHVGTGLDKTPTPARYVRVQDVTPREAQEIQLLQVNVSLDAPSSRSEIYS